MVRSLDQSEVARLLGELLRPDRRPFTTRGVRKLHGRGLPHVRIGRTLSYDESAVRKWVTRHAVGIVSAFAFILLSPTTPAASPTFPEPAASSASRPAAGSSISAMRVPAGETSGAGSNTTRSKPFARPTHFTGGQVGGHSMVLSPISPSPVRDVTGGNAGLTTPALRASRAVSQVKLGGGAAPTAGQISPKPRVGADRVEFFPRAVSPAGGSESNNLGPAAMLPKLDRWHGIDLRRLSFAESGNNDRARGANGERGRFQITRIALADVNESRTRRSLRPITRASLTNSAASEEAAREFISILVRRIRAAGFEPTPNAIVCAWNDGVGDARRYGFDITKAPRETRRLAQ